MGGMVDFDFLTHAGSLDPIAAIIERTGNSIAEERARKAKMAEEQRQFDARNTLEAERTKAITDRENRMERNQNAQMEVENSKRRMAADKEILARLAAGDTAGARQLDAGYAEVNPADQTVARGRGLEIKDRDLGPEPTAPADLPEGAEGPIPSPQDVRRAGMIDKAHGQTLTPQAEYASAMSERDAQAKLGPTVRLGGVDTSMDEIRNNARRQSAEDFSKVGDALQMEMRQAMESGDPLLREQASRRAERYQQIKAGVESGALKPFDAMKMLTGSQALDDKYRENRVHDNTVGQFGLQRQAIANQKPTADSRRAATGAADPKELSAAESALQHFQKNFNIPENRAQDAQLGSLLANKDKAIVQRAITSVLSRGLAGEKGVLTDQDINRLQKNLGGAWTEVENWFSKGASGQLSPDVMSRLEEGIRTVLQQHDTIRGQAKSAYDKSFGPGSAYSFGGKLDQHLKNKRAEMFGDDEAGAGAPGGESREERIARLKKMLGGGP